MPTINGVWYHARRLPIATTTVGENLVSRGCLVTGWSFVESTGAAAAAFELLDGNDQNGIDAVEFTLTANQSTRDFWGDDGIYFESGPYLNVLSGSVKGALWYVDVALGDLVRGRSSSS